MAIVYNIYELMEVARQCIFYICILVFATIKPGRSDNSIDDRANIHNQGNLSFIDSYREIHLDGDEKYLKAVFGFLNTGDRKVSIIRIKSSCGCVEPILNKMEIAPGELCEIDIRLNTTFKKERKVFHIALFSDEPNSKSYTLTFVSLPQAAAVLSSYREEWRIGSSTEQREILVRILDEKTHIIDATVNNVNFDIKVIPILMRKQYRVLVKPRTCMHKAIGLLRLRTDNAEHRYINAVLTIEVAPENQTRS